MPVANGLLSIQLSTCAVQTRARRASPRLNASAATGCRMLQSSEFPYELDVAERSLMPKIDIVTIEFGRPFPAGDGIEVPTRGQRPRGPLLA